MLNYCNYHIYFWENGSIKVILNKTLHELRKKTIKFWEFKFVDIESKC